LHRERGTADDAVSDSDRAYPVSHILDQAPTPFAITRGPTHALVYANASFRRLVGIRGIEDVPIGEALLPEARARLGALLDLALVDGVAVHNQFLGRLTKGAGSWTCSVWPSVPSGNAPPDLTVELRLANHVERTEALQREVAERLLLSALREAEMADIADASRGRLAYLLDAGRRLGASMDETVTRDVVAGITLPALGAWCIVDVVEPDSTVTRLAIIHPDPRKQELLRSLAKDWMPRAGDPFGAPAVMDAAQPAVAEIEPSDVDEALAGLPNSADDLRLLSEFLVGPVLTVPLVSHGRVLGAVTFVSGQPGRSYGKDDVELAEGLAARSAEALNSARLYGVALSLREQADATSRSRMRFLGNISHELRTPLNAISGFAELLEDGVRGPINDAQRKDLQRIRLNQRQLLVLITDILNFVRAGLSPASESVAVPVQAAVGDAIELLAGMAVQKSIRLVNEVTDGGVLADADPDRLRQILLNLLSNALKFTLAEGTITIRCGVVAETVLIRVVDTGIGIDAEKMDTIFDPFVQVDARKQLAGGVGLGLAISRDLARAMRGELTVESAPGVGSTFTLTLPRRVE
jgi:signal transduction histidine kinase